MESIVFFIFWTMVWGLQKKICQESLKSLLPVKMAGYNRLLQEWDCIYAIRFVNVWDIDWLCSQRREYTEIIIEFYENEYLDVFETTYSNMSYFIQKIVCIR